MLRDLAAVANEIEAPAQTRLILRMHGDAAPAAAEHPPQHVAFVHKQRSGGRAHKDLHPAAARQALQLAEIVGILRRGADEEGMVAPRDRKSTRLNSSHQCASRMPSS